MLKRIIGSNIIKRLNHTHSKTIFPENNKTIEHLLRQQNEHLDRITKKLTSCGVFLFGTQLAVSIIALKYN